MIIVLHILQTIAGAAWLVVLVWLFPGFVRLLRGRGSNLDMRAMPTVLIAVTMVMGSLRWAIFPDTGPLPTTSEIVTRMGTISLGLLAAVSILMIRHKLVKD